MKTIQLTQGKVALVDDADYTWLNKFKWQAHFSNGNWYAHRSIRVSLNKRKTICMHREILGIINPKIYGDHENHNGLDNQRHNLRTATQQQNIWNSKKRVNSVSKYIGVTWDKQRNKWRVRICSLDKRIDLGHFKDEILAAKAYDDAARLYFEEFANTNFK